MNPPSTQEEDYPDEVVLDMTNRSGRETVHSMSELPFHRQLKCIELGLCRISKIEGLGAESTPFLEKLTLRGNQITKIESLQGLSALKHLDLYGNEIKKIEGLESLSCLETLDISFNEIRSVDPESDALDAVKGTLRELYLISNKFKTLGDFLRGFDRLELLEVGSNRLRDTEGISHLPSLVQLFAGRNKLTEIPRECIQLEKLKVLSLQSNRITEIRTEGVFPEGIEEIYLSHNGVSSMEPFRGLSKLRVLDLDSNRITNIDVAGLESLEELWLASNSIEAWDGVAHVGKVAKGLKTIYLEHNGIASDPRYRAKIKDMIPSLEQIDAEMILHMPS